MKKKTLAIISGLLVFALNANVFADVLGNLVSSTNKTLEGNAVLYHNKYESGSTKQSEYYFDYKPNSDVIPVVVNGEKIFGKRTIMQAISYMQERGLKPIMGINADYFSFKTGIPMGHTIIDGKLVTSDTTGQNAIGFNADGTGFISWLQIQSKFTKSDGSEMVLDCINKWCQPTINASYLLTDMFGESTETEGNCKYIIFSSSEGELKIGSTIKLKVDEKFDYDGEIAIPKGKYVLCMTNGYGDKNKLAYMDSLNVGDEVSLSNTSLYNPEKWNNVLNGIGSVGGRLIENGTVNSKFEAGTAPRTAVGVKADGNIIFYVIDGRQDESTGVQIKTLAKRMAELGCVDAINLDGGGSTAMAGIVPGSTEYEVINSPSDLFLRSCANYLFLQVNNNKVEVASYKVSDNRNFLSGYTENVDFSSAVDMSKIELTPNNSENTNVTVDGTKVTANGNGDATVSFDWNGGKVDLNYSIFESPDNIQVLSNGKQIDRLDYAVGGKEEHDFKLNAYLNGVLLNSDDNCFKFSCDESIGTINNGGYFVPETSEPAEGNIYIEAGNYKKTIPVTVTAKNVFYDTENHWSKDYALSLYNSGIVKGENTTNGLAYRPDSSITRGEFAAIVIRALGLDVENYSDYEFADLNKTPDWMKPYINAIATEGYMTGKTVAGKTYFAPNDYITRAEAITVLGRISGKTTDQVFEYTDSYSIPDYAKQHVNLLASLGIINGYKDGSINPFGLVTRGECAKMICVGKEKL